MTPLLISPEVKQEIAKVIAYAEANRIPIAEMERLVERKGEESPGDDPRRSVVIPYGFRCVFTIEQQKPPLGWTRHLSVSVVTTPSGLPVTQPIGGVDATTRRKGGRVVNIPAMRMIMAEFGMVKPLEECYVHFDELDSNGAVNVIEPMGGPL